MVERENPGLAAQLAASLDWWRDAGVDALFHDEATDWIAVPGQEKQGERPREGGDLGQSDRDRSDARGPGLRGDAAVPETSIALSFPTDLAAFTAWWLAEPALDGGRIAGRVPPRGSAGAKVMVLVDEPERDDGETLLSGPQGRLLEAMLAAMGVAPDDAYVASVLPRHTPHPDWESVARAGLGRAAAHHVALVAPQQLVCFGSNIPSLIGNDPPNSSESLPVFHHDGASVPWLAERSLGALLDRPRWKAGFWRKWLSRAGVS